MTTTTTTAASARARTLAPLLAVALATGCSLPGEPAPSPTPSATASEDDLLDADVEALEARVDELRTTIAALRTALEATASGEDRLDEAAALLVADVPAVLDPAATPTEPEAGDAEAGDAGDGDAEDADEGQDEQQGVEQPTDDGGPAPVLPGPLVSRAESVGYGDLLTTLLAASRSAGGAGAGVQRFLADPLAGDLGAWQRAPADQLALIGDAGRLGSLEDAESAILGLTGETPRALAWVVHGLTEPDDAAEAAGRALAHLAVVELALEQL